MGSGEQTRTVDLRQVVVRPIAPEERACWEDLMERHHYLGSRPLIGESMRYVAVSGSCWIALLGWATGAFKCGSRDRFIGWPPYLQWQRLPWLANNARFLLLPGPPVPNLASRILSLNLRRLGLDWEQRYGHRIALAETFVDPKRFRGTCYRAAGWQELGETRGFARQAGRYVAHGLKKRVFVRVVDRRLFSLLAEGSAAEFASHRYKGVPMSLTVAQAESLFKALLTLPDPRRRQGLRHPKTSVVAVALCAVLGGARTLTAIAEAAKRYSQSMLRRLGCRRNERTQRYEAPSEPTIRRFLRDLDPKALEAAIGDWLSRLGGDRDDVISVDGKSLRGARREEGNPVHLLSVFATGLGVVLAQREVPPETNEIPVAKEVLGELNLKGKLVLADALHTHEDLARMLVEKEADYCFVVKKNQPILHDDIELFFRSADFPPTVHKT